MRHHQADPGSVDPALTRIGFGLVFVLLLRVVLSSSYIPLDPHTLYHEGPLCSAKKNVTAERIAGVTGEPVHRKNTNSKAGLLLAKQTSFGLEFTVCGAVAEVFQQVAT